MTRNTTRRRLLQGLAVGAVGSSAGCIAGSLDDQSGTSTENSSSKHDPAGTESGSYSVSIVPTGKVTFEEVPQKWLASSAGWADMGIALGRDPPESVLQPNLYFTDQYYEEIPDVTVDESEIINLGNISSTEVFYEMAADLHVMDPNRILHRVKAVERSDIERIKKNVAPFFGNFIDSHDFAWHDDYRYYTLYEVFGKLAQVFQQQKRYKAFTKLHEEMQRTIEANLPSGKHPAVARLWPVREGKFLPTTIDKGTGSKQWRDLKVRDALAKAGIKDCWAGACGSIDYEVLLEIDPDVLLIHGREDYSAKKFQNTVVKSMKNHPIASELQAVNNGRVFRAGTYFQGPITNLVVTERAAHQIYPDAFSGVKLYDPQRVSDIVHGRF